MQVLGIDIGGTGIKAAPVDLTTGTLAGERVKLPTPRPAVPDVIAGVLRDLAKGFGWTGPIGITFPGVVINGITTTAHNLGQAWIGLDTRALFAEATGLEVTVINDADAAGVAEMKFGAGAGRAGDRGDADIRHGDRQRPVPGRHPGAEHRVRPHRDPRPGRGEAGPPSGPRNCTTSAGAAGPAGSMSTCGHVEALVAPDLFIIGGGISRKADKFMPAAEQHAGRASSPQRCTTTRASSVPRWDRLSEPRVGALSPRVSRPRAT